ncbi:DNase I-like protein, partial [Auricularia subglabra TFB-10046 SS5]
MNSLLTNAKEVEHRVLIPGRAIMIKFEWHGGDYITMVGVYAPTDKAQNDRMWATLEEVLHADGIRPDVLMGDFNFVEDPIDRYPAGLGAIDSPETFASLKRSLSTVDGWRTTFPSTIEWTWRNSARSSMSRIDRIYLTRPLNASSREWKISITGITKDDHSRVQTDITHSCAPESGPGRWSMREFLTRDKDFMTEVNKQGLELHRRMSNITSGSRTPESNAQRLWHSFKVQIASLAKERTRNINCK